MIPGTPTGETSGEQKTRHPAAPSIPLPQGGDALRGIGEKFAANRVASIGSMSVPVAINRGRSGFGAQLSLSYDSGAGNDPFGFGWNLSLPSITARAVDEYRQRGTGVIWRPIVKVLPSSAMRMAPTLLDVEDCYPDECTCGWSERPRTPSPKPLAKGRDNSKENDK
ncbi:SpvB/TcaC N-terminal domain-containing protein [Cupriavidus necator]|uniref:SpvB/TcaC N-terminal domain-containing protein n=1 Tax=Cupriavidus necator TaxID=106590 RepID=UPI0039C1E9CB